jgi:hypothetical protein
MTKTFNTNEFEKYYVTGILVNGKRFSQCWTNFYYANGINLYRGSVWGVRKDNGKRQLLKRVFN